MKAKTRNLHWIMLFILMVPALNSKGQNTNPTQTVCPGIQTYYVTPGNVNSTFLWTVVPDQGWTITQGADAYHININWANPAISTKFTVSLSETSPLPNSCSVTHTVEVTVNPFPIATIAYADSPYCPVGTAIVTQTGQTGGSFNSTPGLVINAVTGEINLVTSLPGTYSVTYLFTNGTCTNSISTSLTINALPSTSPIYHN